MAVPISYFDKHNPDQFEIIDANTIRTNSSVPIKPHGLIKDKEALITNPVSEIDTEDLTNTIEAGQLLTAHSSQLPAHSSQLTAHSEFEPHCTTHNICTDCYPAQDVTALWESPSASLINTAPNSLKFLVQHKEAAMIQFPIQKNMMTIGSVSLPAKEQYHPAERQMRTPICFKMTEKEIISSMQKEELFSLRIKEFLSGISNTMLNNVKFIF